MESPAIIYLLRDGAAGDLLHLLVQHQHSRLSLDDIIADEHAQRHKHPVIRQLGQLLSDVVARGHKAHVHARQEQRQPHQRVQHAHQDLYQSLAAQLQEEDLKHHEKREDGCQRQQDLFRVIRQGVAEFQPKLPRAGNVRNGQRRIRPPSGL